MWKLQKSNLMMYAEKISEEMFLSFRYGQAARKFALFFLQERKAIVRLWGEQFRTDNASNNCA